MPLTDKALRRQFLLANPTDHVITAKQHFDNFYSCYYRKLCVNNFAKMSFLPHNYRKDN